MTNALETQSAAESDRIAKALEIQSSIPTGAEFRILLNSNHITYGEVHAVLKQKGIFVGNSDKSVTVPILSATLLTPNEFSRLIEASVDRESRPKTKPSSLDLVSSDSDWITPLKESLFTQGIDFFADIAFTESINDLKLVVHSKDKISIPYMVKRRDISQDWIKRELNFSGSITIERKGNSLKLDFTATHTSPETEAVNRKITSRISKILKKAGVSKTDMLKRITFDSFTNTERVRFFKRLTAGVARVLGRGDVNDMEISRNIDSKPLPDDPQVSWMNQTVKRLKIDGDRLNDIFLISDEKYYSYYHVLRMDVTFPYTIKANQGSCRVRFSFSSSTRSDTDRDNSELIFEFSPTHDGQVNSDSKKDISAKLERGIRDLIDTEYEKIVAKREMDVSIP